MTGKAVSSVVHAAIGGVQRLAYRRTQFDSFGDVDVVVGNPATIRYRPLHAAVVVENVLPVLLVVQAVPLTPCVCRAARRVWVRRIREQTKIGYHCEARWDSGSGHANTLLERLAVWKRRS